MKISRAWLRAGAGVAAAGALFVGVVGYAHTPAGRWMLRYLPGMRCPIGADRALTADERARAREDALAKFRGESAAKAKPAAGFELGSTTRADVDAWAHTAGVRCESGRVRAVEKTCHDVPATALGADVDADVANFVFDGRDRLVSINLTRNRLDAERAASFVEARTATFTALVGAPTKRKGTPSAAYLGADRLRQVSSEFAFNDYRAVVTATHYGGGRVVVREQFQLM